jgi:hypothetical protein
MLDARLGTIQQSIGAETAQAGRHEQALVILQELEKTWRGQYEADLAAVGGQGLSAVFAKTIEVVLESTIKRGVASLDFALITDGLRTRIKGAKGGSVAQVLSTMLRLLTTLSNRPPLRRLLALDEPFSMVSAEFRPALCAMLREITERLDFQLLLTAHEEEMLDAADVAYAVLDDGKGTLKPLKTAGEVRA